MVAEAEKEGDNTYAKCYQKCLADKQRGGFGIKSTLLGPMVEFDDKIACITKCYYDYKLKGEELTK